MNRRDRAHRGGEGRGVGGGIGSGAPGWLGSRVIMAVATLNSVVPGSRPIGAGGQGGIVFICVGGPRCDVGVGVGGIGAGVIERRIGGDAGLGRLSFDRSNLVGIDPAGASGNGLSPEPVASTRKSRDVEVTMMFRLLRRSTRTPRAPAIQPSCTTLCSGPSSSQPTSSAPIIEVSLDEKRTPSIIR